MENHLTEASSLGVVGRAKSLHRRPILLLEAAGVELRLGNVRTASELLEFAAPAWACPLCSLEFMKETIGMQYFGMHP